MNKKVLYSVLVLGLIPLNVGSARADEAPVAHRSLVPIDVSAFYVNPNSPATLRWATNLSVGQALAYQILDYTGRLIKQGNAKIASGDVVAIDINLSQGWYEVRFPESSESFGIVSSEPRNGDLDPFFCIDAALSWNETRAELRAPLVRALKRSGVALVRERLSWGRLNPAKDTWDWDGAPRRHDTMRKIYREEGVPLLEILGGAAPRVPHLGDVPGSPFPRNYEEVLPSLAKIIDRFHTGWGAEETWNEPELTQIPADQFVSITKVASFAAQRARLNIPTGGGALATIPPGAFFDTAVANGFLNNIDYVSFHTYDPARTVEALIAHYRDWLRTAGKESMPIWITESGMPWTSGPPRPPFLDDAQSALEIVMKGVEFRAGGIARYFPFVYTFYGEGAKNFGMLGREASPLRAMGAYANAIQTLSGYHYAGDLATPIPEVDRARFFESSDNREPDLLVLYSGKVALNAQVTLPFPALRSTGIDGREFSISPTGLVPIPDGLTYVWLARDADRNYLRTDTRMRQLQALAQKAAPEKAPASPIILQYLFEQTSTQPTLRCYWLDEPVAKDLPITVRASNLGDKNHHLTLRLRLPQRLDNQADEIRSLDVPSDGFAEARWRLDAANALDLAEPRLITITATAERGQLMDTLAIPFGKRGSLEEHLALHPRKQRMPIEEVARWRPNVAADGQMSLSTNHGIFRADAQLKQASGWLFPRFVVPTNTFSEHSKGVLVRARLLQAGRHGAVYAEINDRERFWIDNVILANGTWQVAYLPLDEFVPAPGHPDLQNARFDYSRIQRLSFGCVSNGLTNALEVSDLWIIDGP